MLLKIKIFTNLKIRIPSLETQKRIVSKIEKIETIVNEAKKIVDGVKEKKKRFLKNICKG